ncbi:MAG: MFS transporter [Deltaproteobacteria bacterium]|nr:MFS transporter [Deltaproteobacteria bacterium]
MHKKNITIKESLKACWVEGAFANVMLGIFDYYLIPFALFLGAKNLQIGFLVAFSHLLGSLSQIFSVNIAKKIQSRQKLLINFSILQGSLLIFIASLIFISSPLSIYFLMVLTILFRILANILGAFWGSLVSEYLPPEKRGIYFGWRSQIVGLAGLGGVAFGGMTLHFFENGFTGKAFFILFALGCLCRFFSAYYFTKMKDLPTTYNPEHQFTFKMFIKSFRKSNFAKFTFFVGSLTLATYISAPYYAVYLLQDLKFSYGSYMIIQVAAVIGGLVAFPIWGKHADLVGNAKMLKLSSVLIPLVPIAVLVSPHFYYLFCVELIGGILWGGFNLCAINFIYDAVTPPKRMRCLSYFTLINGIAIFIGSTSGGFIIPHLPTIKGFHLLTLFLISGILRFASYIFLFHHFKEVRAVQHQVSSLRLFFSVVKARPLIGLARGWNAMIILKDFFEKEEGGPQT